MIKDGNIGEKPRSSISALIDVLCTERYDEDSLDGVAEIVDSINLQPSTGPQEASRAIRKKLKYSNVHGQLRALTILKVLVENCGSRFESTFADERLIERIKVIAGDPHTDPRVKKKNMQVLGSWYIQFKDDPRMRTVAGLYKACGGGGSGGAAAKQVSRTDATAAYEAQQERYEREAALRAERKAAERRAREAAEERAAQEKLEKARRKEAERARATSGAKVKRPKFNFELEKPKIMTAVGAGAQAAQALVNALQLVNREKESVTTNERVQDCLEKAKSTRKLLIRYIQLIDQDTEGDYIGTLISTNEQIIAAVQMYDRMSKPAELDSDDEAVEEAKRLAQQQGLSMPASATPQHVTAGSGRNNDDTQSIRSALSNFDLQDREVDKLQMQQRRRLQRHLSSRGGPSSAAAVHPDLQDLAFGPSGSSSLPPPIQPLSSEDMYRHGSLSDFSDYSSEEEGDDDVDDYSAAPDPHGATPARSYAAYVREEDHRAAAAADMEDPFADPFADSNAGDYEVLTPGIAEKRMEWKEV